MSEQSAHPIANKPSAFAPLRNRVFAVLWVATVIGNIGTFMRDVASSWLITDLTTSPLAVSAVQAAGTLPVFLLAIPAGVLSDILDKRRFLLGTQVFLACTSAALLTFALLDMMSVTALIVLTAMGGIGAALMTPTWQAIVPDIVGKGELRSAVGLNILGVNIARSTGPALGGFLVASFGVAVAYGADAASYLFVIAAILWWRRSPAPRDQLSEQFAGAFRAGLRYARASRPLHVVLVRAGFLFIFASSLWGLLPLVARNLLNGSAGFYGMLLGGVGIGAILGAIFLPRVRAAVSQDTLVAAAGLCFAAVIASLAFGPPQWAAITLMVLLGTCWISLLTTFSGTAQAILPSWVRGRALAVYITVFNGSLAAGSLLWGFVAEHAGLRTALIAAAAGLIVVSIIGRFFSLPRGEADLSPSMHWPDPSASSVALDRGPVMVLIEYVVRAEDKSAFLKALNALSEQRRRDGAFRWGVFEDTGAPERITEWFMVESWAEHMRQHKRVSKADADVQGELAKFHRGDGPPRVQHLIHTR